MRSVSPPTGKQLLMSRRMSRFPSGPVPLYGTTAPAVGMNGSAVRLDAPLPPPAPSYVSIPASVSHAPPASTYGSYATSSSQSWPVQSRYSPDDTVDDLANMPDYGRDSLSSSSPPSGLGRGASQSRPQRRSSNRDEFNGPQVQYLARPPSDYIAMQEREMPHLPTNLLVSEQDNVLAAVNDRLSQCAFDFVAKYQFPIPLTQEYVADPLSTNLRDTICLPSGGSIVWMQCFFAKILGHER